MQDNVDYRLLERFKAHRRVNMQPPAPQPEPRRAAAAAAHPRQRPAIDLRD
jgi:hypothetical protein